MPAKEGQAMTILAPSAFFVLWAGGVWVGMLRIGTGTSVMAGVGAVSFAAGTGLMILWVCCWVYNNPEPSSPHDKKFLPQVRKRSFLAISIYK